MKNFNCKIEYHIIRNEFYGVFILTIIQNNYIIFTIDISNMDIVILEIILWQESN